MRSHAGDRCFTCIVDDFCALNSEREGLCLPRERNRLRLLSSLGRRLLLHVQWMIHMSMFPFPPGPIQRCLYVFHPVQSKLGQVQWVWSNFKSFSFFIFVLYFYIRMRIFRSYFITHPESTLGSEKMNQS